MTVRTSRKSVTFTQPFSLSGFDEVQPAGTYTVETDEELLPGLSFPAYRRVATLMVLRARGGAPVEVANIDPLELQAAQERDAGQLSSPEQRARDLKIALAAAVLAVSIANPGQCGPAGGSLRQL